MGSESRQLHPLQADLDNGCVVLRLLTLRISVCLCAKWSPVWSGPAPSLHPHQGETTKSNFLYHTHSHTHSHGHFTDAAIVTLTHLVDSTAVSATGGNVQSVGRSVVARFLDLFLSFCRILPHLVILRKQRDEEELKT